MPSSVQFTVDDAVPSSHRWICLQCDFQVEATRPGDVLKVMMGRVRPNQSGRVAELSAWVAPVPVLPRPVAEELAMDPASVQAACWVLEMLHQPGVSDEDEGEEVVVGRKASRQSEDRADGDTSVLDCLDSMNRRWRAMGMGHVPRYFETRVRPLLLSPAARPLQQSGPLERPESLIAPPTDAGKHPFQRLAS